MTDNIDRCFALVDAAPALANLEIGDARPALDKLIEDAGVVIDRLYNGFDPNEAAPGPNSSRLNTEFTDVTLQRIQDVLRASLALAADESKNAIISLMKKMDITEHAAPVVPTTDKPSFKR